ncbi:ABC transporter permease [Sporomusa termitida]|uniref:Glycine betaine/carnitine/choline transport system permease protein OpuCB n=1 Tax=Sporomusa termitida TaxID=2377 RepID=A0A517DPR6_9FIRM|nr:ABC transporter permease [Sporomusa termitida]QDR79276.1 Glycine betaine/carnitine/choline transport system permease protein OpuCB [Sporomusa termitida]
MNYLKYIQNNYLTIADYFQTHCSLVLWVVIISLVIWVPVGVLITRNETWAKRVLAIANTIFCIPSLALFAILITIPFLGLGRRSALVALVLYAMMPLVRNVYHGVKNVDKSVIEAARGMGMGSWRILREIELPLAMPIIFAGFRITVVMTTGTAAIATYIGERNLGRLIAEGLTRFHVEMIVVGALFVAVMAIALDSILGYLEKRVVSCGFRVRS